MLEPPSQELVRQLTELQLCRPSDWRRARSRVRRLAHDLPAFDSVWIDSLVQLRLLTPYQAKRLESGESDQLRIGSLVVIDELGCSERATTLLARPLNRHDRCVVKRLRVSPERSEAAVRQMQLTLDRTAGFAHPNLVLPHQLISASNHELVVVSRLIPGLPLNDLLVRRGRFPAPVVLEIGRQLLEGLTALHQRSLLHGDLRMSNVRLTEAGLAVLVDGGLRQVIHSEITIHDVMSLEAYDGLAPELIGTGAAATASSELYALGCLLWQLLAGRPPFITADRLAKIAAHQTQTIEDVRTLAPDTPPLLAEMIRQMTSADPQLRPRGFDEVLQRWGRAGSFGRSRLKQFRQLFDTAVPHFTYASVSHSKGPWIWLTCLVLAASGSLAMFYNRGLPGELLMIVQKFQTAASTPQQPRDPADSTDTGAADSENTAAVNRDAKTRKSPLPLPKPSSDGVIQLTHRGPYSASAIAFAGNLCIRGAQGTGSEIVVDRDPLTTIAQEVELDHLTLRGTADGSATFLAKVQSQQLRITNCDFQTGPNDSEGLAPGLMGLAWKPIDRDPKLGTITIKNSVLQGSGSAILLTQPPRRTLISNTLKTGRGPLLSLGPKSSATDFKLELDRVTLRQSGALLRLAGDCTTKIGIAPLLLQADHCVFDLAERQSGLITIDTEQPRSDLSKIVELKATETCVTPGASLLTAFDASQKRLREVDADEQFDGLDISDVQFAGDHPERISDSRITGLKGPRRAIDVDLPGAEPRLIGPTSRNPAPQ